MTTHYVVASDIFDISTKVENNQLIVQYQLAQPEQVESIQAKINDITLPQLSSENYPIGDEITAILFLVDVSDPRRRRVVEKN